MSIAPELVAVAAGALAELNCPPDGGERAAIVASYLAVVDGAARVVDEHGRVMMGAGDVPLPITEFIESHLCYWQVPGMMWRAAPSNFSPRRCALPPHLLPRAS